MITIQEWKTAVANVARSNRFLVDFNMIKPSEGNDPWEQYRRTNFFYRLGYLAQDAHIPNRTQNNISVKFHGLRLEMPGDYEHADFTIKFLNGKLGGTHESNWYARNFFEKWMDLIQNIDLNNRLIATTAISLANITVTQLGLSENDKLASYQFRYAYPKELSDITLSMGNSEVQTFTVTFAYSSWRFVDPENMQEIVNNTEPIPPGVI